MHAINHKREIIRPMARWGFRAAVLTLASAGLLAGAGAAAEDGDGAVHQYKINSSGWEVYSAGADFDGSMSNGNETTALGHGTFGATVEHAMTDFADWDGTSFCDFDPDTGAPRALEVVLIAYSSILVTPNGDQLIRKISSSPASTICFNFTTFMAENTVYLDVVGGTGRFEGASGNSVVRQTVTALGNIDSITAVEEGSISYYNQ